MPVFFAGLAVILAGALLVSLYRSGERGEYALKVCMVLGGAAAAIPAVRVLVTGESIAVRVAASVPGGDWSMGLDALSSVFVLTILAVGFAAAFYGVTYSADERPHRAVWFGHAVFAVLIVAMLLVVTARAVVPFLCAWAVMALASYLLIVTEREHAEVRRAGLLYLIVTHAGTLALFVMFAIWSQASGGDWSFASLAAATPLLSRGTSLIFALAFLGFGVKAGAVPFHFWLPPAHAAAPSHVSALMSGIVIKTGIYGFLRVLVIAGGAPAWWGWTMLVVGTGSAVLGVLWALAQHDLKRLLAYHSVENIGIILMGIAVGVLGSAYGYPALAVLGYAAAVLHTVNHALFKSVLFLGAGAVYRATGSRNMEDLGGLARKMPMLTVTFVIGAAAIVGLPPLNGFVSEWLVYQGLFRAGIAGDGIRLSILAVPLLALVGGLALACFAKVVGVVFLGTPRTARARDAKATPRGLVSPPAALALVCVAIGVLPVLVMPSLLRVGVEVASQPQGLALAELTGTLRDAQRLSWFAVAVWLVLGAVWTARGAALRKRAVRSGPTWACGYEGQTPRMQYTASSFAAPLLDVFGEISGVQQHRGAVLFHTTPTDLVFDRAIRPLWARVREWALRLRAIQHGRLHVYLLYVVVTLVTLLGYLVLWPE